MINILRPGNFEPETEIVYTTTCPVCRCEFEFTLKDCIIIEKRPNGNISVKCPCCHKETSYVRNELKMEERQIQYGPIRNS